MTDRRTAAPDLSGLDGPSIAAPQVAPIVGQTFQAPTTGFSVFSQGLNNFFGKSAEGIDAVDKAVQYTQMEDLKGQYYQQRAEIAKQKKEAAKAGTADALLGNPAASADEAYMDARKKTLGTLAGDKLFQDWVSGPLANAKPGDNLGDLTDQFIKTQVGQGTGDPTYDATMLSTFHGHVTRPMLQWTENLVKGQQAQGIMDGNAVIAQQLRDGTLNIDTWNQQLDRARAQNPANPEQAPLKAFHALLASANTPDTIARADAFANSPGTGINGKSAAESFPSEYAAFQQHANGNYTSMQSTQGHIQYQQYQEDIGKLALNPSATADDYVALKARGRQIFDQFGGAAQYNSARNALDKSLEAFQQQTTSINAITEMAAGKRDLDPKTLKAYYPAWQASQGITTPFASDDTAAAAGGLAAKVNYIPDDAKATLNKKLTDPASPADMITGYRYLKAFSDRYGNSDIAAGHLEGDAKYVFKSMDDQVAQRGINQLPQIAAEMSANADLRKKEKEPAWSALTGDKTEHDAEANVDARVTSALQGGIVARLSGTPGAFQTGVFGNGDINIDPTTQKAIRDEMKRAVIQAGPTGAEYGNTIDGAIRGMVQSGKLQTLPGQSGQIMVRQLPPPDPRGNPAGFVPFGVAVRPANGGPPENTLQTFYKDVQAASGQGGSYGGDLYGQGATGSAHIGVFDDPSRISVLDRGIPTMDGLPDATANRGVYTVARNGQAVMFTPGQAITMGNKPVTLDADVNKAMAQVAAAIPGDQWVLVPNSRLHEPTAFFLAYKPHFTAAPAPTLDQLKSGVTPAGQQQTQERQQRQDEIARQRVTPEGLSVTQ